MNHFHRCPNCYDKHSCDMSCTIVEDLSDDLGRPFGSHCICQDCEQEYIPDNKSDLRSWFSIVGQNKNPPPPWWLFYNGIKK